MPRFSKPENAPAEETVRKVQRKPKCSRCRNHGFVVTLKGHSGGCPFGLCRCWKCSLITQRTSIMASHRRMKKAHRLECRRASESREVRSRAGGGSGPDHAGGEAGPAVSSSSPVRTQSVTRMTPPQLEAPGGGGACSEVKVRRNPQTHSAAAGTDVGLGALGLGGSDATVTGREIPRWSPANPHFRVDSASAEVFQRKLYLGELMTVPVPVKPLTCYPDSYPILALLLNPPLAWPRGLGDLDLRFPQFQPYTVPNSIDTGPSHVRR
ncbi:hypothetical protein Z043_125130 [Scleropages formosus]|uniref:DM domain-containing protein n=1 Tax=Scleropages formosus TaxID=113540 RepID=A0A0P7TUB4_SCLFO|nr:hypothetical protein Z043_125130 [Scleropages formosus]